MHVEDLQVVASKFRIGAGPGLKSAQATPDLSCRAGKVDQPIFFLKDWSKGRLRVLLLACLDCPALQPTQCLDNQVCAYSSQARRQGFRSVIFINWYLVLQQDVTRIEPCVNPHRGIAGDTLSFGDGPLNGSSTAIFWQERGMEVDVSHGRQVKHPLRDDAAIAYDDNRVRLSGSEASAELFVHLNPVGLANRKIQAQR